MGTRRGLAKEFSGRGYALETYFGVSPGLYFFVRSGSFVAGRSVGGSAESRVEVSLLEER